MVTLETGNPTKLQGGFSLIEMLIVLTLISILFNLASLSFPSTSKTAFQSQAQQLVASLNMAKETCILKNTSIQWRANSSGWSFYNNTWQNHEQKITDNLLKPQEWKLKPTQAKPNELLIDSESFTNRTELVLEYEDQRINIIRGPTGQFRIEQ